MENIERIVPEINFKYWYGVNQKEGGTSQQRVKRIIRAIIRKYNENRASIDEFIHSNNINRETALPYFIDDENEIKRLLEIKYNKLEEEIVKLIDEYEFTKPNDLDLLKIFDLIQIWGGTQGGRNIYVFRNMQIRTNFEQWIDHYRQGIIAASERSIISYSIIMEIEQIAISFGSKHVSFWSRKSGNKDCLPVIDNKIAGTTGNNRPSIEIIEKIVNDIHYYANVSKKFDTHQIEKALFSFHAHYFDNDNKIFTGIEKVDDIDYQVAITVAEKLGIDGNPNNNNPSKHKPSGQNKSNKIRNLVLPKSECLKTKTDIFISAVYVERNNLKKYVDIDNKAKDKDTGKVYFKFKGDSSGIQYL
jgi:hypothetical protein